jgi:hypothetical protein
VARLAPLRRAPRGLAVLTNSREVAGFFLARAIVVAIYFVATPLLLSPLYLQLYRAGGAILMTVATLSIGLVAWLVTLGLFVVLRGAFGGVPDMIAGQGRRDAVTSSVGETAAYLVAVVIVMVLVSTFNALVFPGVLASLRQSGGMMWLAPISVSVSAASAVVFFLIFVALRSAMSGSS